jgi:hypothetical protein
LNPLAENSFQSHLTLLKANFYFEKTIGLNSDWVKIPTFVDESIPNLVTSFFKITMQSNNAIALELPILHDQVIRLWSKLTSSTLF